MYNGFRTERAFYNAKIHALAYTIYGSDMKEFMDAAISNRIARRNKVQTTLFNQAPGDSGNNSCSVLSLTDTEARSLYYELLSICKKVKANTKAANAILGVEN